MNVLDDHQQGPSVGQLLQQVAHPGEQLPLVHQRHRGAAVGQRGFEHGQHRQVRTCRLAHDLGPEPPVGPVHQALHRSQRNGRPRQLEAVRHQYAGLVVEGRRQLADQPRLADAGLAHDKHETRLS